MAYTNIDDPSAYFQIAEYTGNSSSNSATNTGNVNLQPDFIWGKCRSTTKSHYLYDSSRGTEKRLISNSTAAEADNTNGVTAFNSDGFSLNSGNTENDTGESYVAWQWVANGGTTASNTDGSITSTVQANQDAGFSIVTYTTAGSTATIGHGLGAKPDVILLKKRNGAIGWLVRHVSTGTSYLSLDSTTAAVSNPAATWTTTEPTTSVYSIGTSTDVNIDGGEYVAYCFASKQGYSKFGSYVGNANTNGTFVYLGFKPAFVMVKRSDGTSDWTILDNKREGYNVINKRLVANTTAAEATYNVLDFVSNGFKFRDGDGIWNGSSSNYIYMAFAENPFTTSTGVPTTAR
jgi:hypothetical protein